jgi:hypothetical protein
MDPMSLEEIIQRARSSPLLEDPYVKRVWSLINDGVLFNMSPERLSGERKVLTRECLAFLSRHSSYYAALFERADVDPRTAGLNELARLAMPSDMLRGGGQPLIDDVDQGGSTFRSSGTTGREPVSIYRSPLDLAIMVKGNADLFEYVYGDSLEENKGLALFMAAPELKDRLSFVAFVHLALESKGIDLIYGMDMEEGVNDGQPWQKLEPNRGNIMRFLKAKAEPKLFFTAPAGVHLLSERFETMPRGKRMLQRLVTGTPPVGLGKKGVVVTGGGTKGFSDLPPYPDIVRGSRKHFTAKDGEGKDIPTPFMDVLGMTETLTALIDNFERVGKVPHPLSEVFLIDPRTFEVIEDEEKEGVLCIFNPFVTSWMECFYPGDIMSFRTSDTYYGREFTYHRRLSLKEGWGLQRACGGSMEELMEGRS